MSRYASLCRESFYLPQHLLDADIPYQVFDAVDSSKQMLHFFHANGYSPLVYQGLFKKLLQEYRIQAPLLKPLHDPVPKTNISDWWPFVDDMTAYFSAQTQERHVAVGHSIGSTLLLLQAIQNPGRFSALALIDPAIFSRRVYWTYKLLSCLGLQERLHPLFSKTLKRRAFFSSEEDLLSRFRSKPIFNRFSDDALHDYIRGSFVKENDGYHLVYPAEWEAHIYKTGILIDSFIWANLAKISCPILLIRGSESDACTHSVQKRFLASHPQIECVTIPNTGHLVPLEEPTRVADAVLSFFSKLPVK